MIFFYKYALDMIMLTALGLARKFSLHLSKLKAIGIKNMKK